MILVWSNFVALRDLILPEVRHGRRLRPNVVLSIGVGADGGWALNNAKEPMAEAERLGLPCCYSLAALVTYRGHGPQSWYDERTWRAIAINTCRVIDAARAAKHRLLCIDLEPYLDEQSKYPDWPRVGDPTNEVPRAAVAMRPFFSALSRWKETLAVAPGGLEYGVVPLILSRRRKKAMWLDEMSLFARTADNMTAAIRYITERKEIADTIGVPFAPGFHWPLLNDPIAVRRAIAWTQQNRCDFWWQGELSSAAISWLFSA